MLNNQAAFDKLSGKINDVWIFYLGCSYHMTGWREILKNLQPVRSFTICLLNGSEAVTAEQIIVCIGSNLIVYDILLILNLNCN